MSCDCVRGLEVGGSQKWQWEIPEKMEVLRRTSSVNGGFSIDMFDHQWFYNLLGMVHSLTHISRHMAHISSRLHPKMVGVVPPVVLGFTGI